MVPATKCAIALLYDKKGKYHGSVLFKETRKDGPLAIYASLLDLKKGMYGFHVHEYGDSSDPFPDENRSIAGHFDVGKHSHGSRNSPKAHSGDLGNIDVGSSGIGFDTFVAKYIRLSGKRCILGRSVAVHKHKDDLGKGHFKDSKKSGHSGSIMLYGVISLADCSRYPV